ncbi:MAG TPA: recombinase family protein [Lentisphaeria bacterium]|nr:recombinase family protein [Lentisphaeria bacterium]
MSKVNAVIYARQSSGKEEESESIAMQIEKCMELARKRKIEVIATYNDANASGRLYPSGAESIADQDSVFQDWYRKNTAEKKYRPGLRQVLEQLSRIDYVIVYDTTRLYRPIQRSYLQNYVDNQLIANSVKLLTLKEGESNPSDFSDSLVTTIKSHVNDNQIKLTSEKSKAAMSKLKDDGYYATGPKMYGIRYLGGKDRAVEVIPECVEVIRFVFDQIILLKPYNQIVRQMNSRFAGRCAGKGFYDSSFRHIASQPFYCGYMYDTQGALIKAKQMQGKEIITYETWEKVQRIMSRRRAEPQRRKSLPHPFSHLLHCGYCGAKMIVGQDGNKEFYHCFRGANINTDANCRSARVTINLIRHSDEFVGLKASVAPLLALALYKEIEQHDVMRMKGHELEKLKIDLVACVSRLDAAASAYGAGELSLASFQKVEALLNGKILKTKKEIAQIENACASQNKVEERARQFLLKIDDLMADRLEDHVFEELLRGAVTRIDCFNDHLELKTVYGDFTLERFMKGKFRNFPRFTYKIIPVDGFKRDIRKTKINVTYVYGKHANKNLVVDLEVMKIYAQR